ncbi:sulfatase-like hydrolase/transferase [Opitutia bacterium ISCC 51]|nr:sulfatase-like hydrolase/transferase [Opitutae bacterium ISCC 51]QXD30161.1 sulfatase-like hydrolase/transferase [Opitutae bacterium ISCC 52]
MFFIPDQFRVDWMGCASDLPVNTPNIDRLAAEGTRFTRAITPSPLCSPARACLATGMDFKNCGAPTIYDNLPLNRRTYYQSLRDSGYHVAGVGKFDLHKADLDWGVDGSMLLDEYGFSEGNDSEGKGDAIWSYRKEGVIKGPYIKYLSDHGLLDKHLSMYEHSTGNLLFEAVTELPDEAYCDNWIAQNGLDRLQEFSKEQPWHLVVNFAGPHDPYDVTTTMREQWQDVDFPSPVDNDQDDPELILLRQQNYAAMIENIDSQIGRYLDLLEERGELENTVIIFSSDHGEMLGDHNRWQKSIWYGGSVDVPLVVSGAGVGCQVSGALVSFHDIGATILDMAGAEPLPKSDASSFAPVLCGKSQIHRRVNKSALNDWKLISDGRFKLVLKEGEDPLLFDLKTDPNETNNLASEFPCKVVQLQSL